MQLFSELFPLAAAPTLTAYLPRWADDTADSARAGRVLAARLRKRLAGGWLYADDRLLTDSDALLFDVLATVEALALADPTMLGGLTALEPDFMWQPTPHSIAAYIVRVPLAALDSALAAALATFDRDIVPGIRVERAYKATPWDVGGQPAVALTVSARLVYAQDATAFATEKGDPAALIGLRVGDKASGLAGEVVKIMGTVGERRDALLRKTRRDALRHTLLAAAADDWSVRFKSGGKRYELPAAALEILIRPSDLARFGLDERLTAPALRPDPPTRSKYIRALAEVAREAGILGRALSAREHPDLYSIPAFEPYLRFAKNRSRPHNPAKLPLDFIQCGAYHLREAFTAQPIKVGVVNTLAFKIEDFVEALQRQLTRSFDFKIEVIRERKVRVLSLENVEAALRVMEKEQPDLILAFLPDANPTQPDTADLPAFVKSLSLGRGIPAHVLAQTTLDDP
ncbi:MAG: hypothetical protein H7Y11_01615, partial [Armatimonadetes bacterium]|nr:hypothetical protein [Anaerolineae bacterium]